MAKPEVRARIRVFGRVQGVFFRQNALRYAMKIGIRGYIRNLEDGSLEAVYQGPKDKVDQMLQWTKRGPPYAFVSSYRIRWENPADDFSAFEVMY